jgi:hypothetical protein
VLAVLQALAHGAALAGEIVNGIALIELGGRSLSLMAGLMPETTLWQVLRELRDMPGAPLLRTRQAAGNLADRYALITPKLNGNPVEPDAIRIARVQVAPVHDAWRVLGLHNRRIHDLIVHAGMTSPADVLAAAHVGSSAGYQALAGLATAGLITRAHGRLEPGSKTLDDIASAHDLDAERTHRIAAHARQRAAWHAWLTVTFAPYHTVDNHARPELAAVSDPWDATDTSYYLSAVLATGPPSSLWEPVDHADAAIRLLVYELGATILADQSTQTMMLGGL